MSYVLTFFATTANQNHQAIAILTKVNPIARAKIDLVFEQTLTYAFDIRQIAGRETY